MNDNVKFIKCACHGDGMLLEYDTDEFLEISMWKYGTNDDNRMSWRQRLRFIFKFLKTGNPYCDQVMLDLEKQKELADWLNTQIHKRK